MSNRRHCPHSDLRPIYGDEINAVGGRRLQCRTCGRYLDGPVSLARLRARAEVPKVESESVPECSPEVGDE